MNGGLLVKGRARDLVVGNVEVVRSFAYKLNCANHPGGNQYEARDFFCSQKATCAPEDVGHISEALYQWCKAEVLRAVDDYVRLLKARTQS